MAVSIPTRHAMPTAMIIRVKAVRRKLDFSERSASLMFSAVFKSYMSDPEL